MRYSPDEALHLTLERASRLRARRRQRKRLALSVGAGGCACALLGFGYAFAANGGTTLAKEHYGAFLLPSNAGGYFLIGVLAFAAGVLVTLLSLRYRNGSAAGSDRQPAPKMRNDTPDNTGEDSAVNRAAQEEETGQTETPE